MTGLAETSKYKEITLKHLEQFATEGECGHSKYDSNKMKSYITTIIGLFLLFYFGDS